MRPKNMQCVPGPLFPNSSIIEKRQPENEASVHATIFHRISGLGMDCSLCMWNGIRIPCIHLRVDLLTSSNRDTLIGSGANWKYVKAFVRPPKVNYLFLRHSKNFMRDEAFFLP